MKRLAIIFFLGAASAFAGSAVLDYADSFVRSYEFNTAGRYAHEYHPYLLKETTKSIGELESTLSDAGFSLDGRVVIMGYEGNAIPSYFTSFRDCEGGKIDDEYIAKLPKGWSLQLHNRFGLMTGCLFRRCSNPLVSHINPHRIELFHDQMGLFRKDAFGPAFNAVNEAEGMVTAAVSRSDWKAVFSTIMRFWELLYHSEGKTGDSQVAGTQDVLFSIENAKFLRDSTVPLRHFYTGGDITYPILVTKRCGRDATVNAQTFVKQFVPTLKPVADEPTLYVFKSFVDGVGKSTLLGNIKNYLKFGSDVNRYEAVDNSSSVVADVFGVCDKVWIADLPAQMSHFTFKPDGFVYVDLAAVGSTYGDAAQIRRAFEAARTSNSRGWTKLCHGGRDYLVNAVNTSQIRVLLPIAEARSEGLKNVEVDQMFFDKGITFPILYKDFLADLVGKARSHGVKHVVFVDFLSMYPRSSRENVRLNYLLQLLSKTCPGFNHFNTLYRNFSSNSELLALLLSPQGRQSVQNALYHEVIDRYALFKLIGDDALGHTGSSTNEAVLGYVQGVEQSVSSSERHQIEHLVAEKVERETAHLKAVYGRTKDFVNLYTFSHERLLELSPKIEQILASIENPHLQRVWGRTFGSEVIVDKEFGEGEINEIVALKNGEPMRAIYRITTETRSAVLLQGLFQRVRTAWYAALINLLYSDSEGGRILLEEEVTNVLPLIVRRGSDGAIYLLQKSAGVTLTSRKPGSDKPDIGVVDTVEYPLNPASYNLPRGLMFFGFDRTTKPGGEPYLDAVVSDIVTTYQEEHGANEVISTSELYKKFDYFTRVYYPWILRHMYGAAKQRQANPNATASADDTKDTAVDDAETEDQTPLFCDESQRDCFALYAQAAATIEMVVRDSQSDIVVLPDNDQDFFSALKLIEEVILPQYVRRFPEQPIFDGNRMPRPLI